MLANFDSNEPIYTIAVGTAITKATGKRGNAKQHGTILTVDRIKEKIASLDDDLKNRYTYAGDLYHDIRHGGTRSDQIDGDVVMRVGLPIGIEKLTVSGTGLWYGIYSQNLYN